MEQVERVTAEEIRATGIQWAFGPCVTVPQDIRWGRTYEGFSEDPKLVRELAGPAVRGFQGKDLQRPAGRAGVRQALRGRRRHRLSARRRDGARPGRYARSTRPRCASIHLQGYYSAIEAGVGIHHALLQQLERRESARPARPC